MKLTSASAYEEVIPACIKMTSKLVDEEVPLKGQTDEKLKFYGPLGDTGYIFRILKFVL